MVAVVDQTIPTQADGCDNMKGRRGADEKKFDRKGWQMTGEESNIGISFRSPTGRRKEGSAGRNLDGQVGVKARMPSEPLM